MRIGILSDTHGKMAGIDGAFSIFDEHAVTIAVHCGDWANIDSFRRVAEQAGIYGIEVYGVLGNNDTDVETIEAYLAAALNLNVKQGVLDIVLDEKHILVYHGHHQPTLRSALAAEYDVLMLGHSHKPRYDKLDDKLVINPGSTAFSIPRSRDWQASVAIYDTRSHEAEFFYFDPRLGL